MNCLQRKVKLSDQGKMPAIKPIYEKRKFWEYWSEIVTLLIDCKEKFNYREPYWNNYSKGGVQSPRYILIPLI